MKYVIVIPDGCADEPIDALGGKTPLQAAAMPATDSLAAAGALALSNNTPAHLPAGSEVANLCLLGYDPDVYFTGRAPLEAAAQGITLAPNDWAVRCNLVTIEDQIMVDFTADHISTEEATELLRSAQETVVQQLAKVTVMVAKEAGEDGKLFGSVTSNDVLEGLKAKGVEVELDKKKLIMPEKTIKEVGTYEVGVKLPYGLTAAIKLEVKTKA